MTLKRISMRDQVYEIIKNRILSREYSLGEPINIVYLSKELGISNTPIREALSQLETERLITINSNQKYHVTDLNEKLINDLCSVVPVSYTHLDVYKRQVLMFFAPKDLHTVSISSSVASLPSACLPVPGFS